MIKFFLVNFILVLVSTCLLSGCEALQTNRPSDSNYVYEPDRYSLQVGVRCPVYGDDDIRSCPNGNDGSRIELCNVIKSNRSSRLTLRLQDEVFLQNTDGNRTFKGYGEAFDLYLPGQAESQFTHFRSCAPDGSDSPHEINVLKVINTSYKSNGFLSAEKSGAQSITAVSPKNIAPRLPMPLPTSDLSSAEPPPNCQVVCAEGSPSENCLSLSTEVNDEDRNEYWNRLSSLVDLFDREHIPVNVIETALNIKNASCSIGDLELDDTTWRATQEDCSFRTNLTPQISVHGFWGEKITLKTKRNNGNLLLEFGEGPAIAFFNNDGKPLGSLNRQVAGPLKTVAFEKNAIFFGTDRMCIVTRM